MEQTQPLQKKRLSRKQKNFAVEFAKTDNGVQSALKTYDTVSYKTASTIADANLDKPSVIEVIEKTRKTLKEALYDAGITPQKIADKVNVLLDSEDDKNAINNGLKHATNIYGVEEAEKPKTGNTYNFIFNADVQKKIKGVEDEIKNLLRKKNVQEN